MSGRTAEEAVDRFAPPFAAVLSCCARNVHVRARHPRDGAPGLLLFNGGRLIRISESLHFLVSHQFEVVQDEAPGRLWTAKSQEYAYEVLSAGEKVIAFHWHPSENRVAFPHIHFEKGAGVRNENLQRAHIPSGRVSLAAVVRFLIEDFGVPPQRRDWSRVLTEAEELIQ